MPNPNQNLRRAPPQHITENRTYRNIVGHNRKKYKVRTYLCFAGFYIAAVYSGIRAAAGDDAERTVTLRTQSNGGGWVGRLDAGEESGDVNVHVDEDYCQETPWQYSKVMEQRD